MEYVKLGNSDLYVSRICMGCMGFGDSTRGQHSRTLDEEHSHADGAVKAVDLKLDEKEISYLEEPYTAHPLAGVMAQNTPNNAN